MSLKSKILRALGVNETRLKWKQAQRESRSSTPERDGRSSHEPPARERTKHCVQCRALVSADERRCPDCGAALPTMTAVRVRRALRSLLPEEQPTTKVVLAVIFGLFVVMTLDGAQLLGSFGDALMRPPMQVMWRWGAHLRGDFELWRIVTSNFLHFGVVHLLFNAWALRIAGPEVERIFGSALAMVLFVATGVGAMAISNLIGAPGGLVAGASGSLMGFIGLAAAGGHRDASSYGRTVRDQMVRWAVFVMFLGIAAELTGFMAIENIAHGAGLVLGGALGMVLPMRTLGRRASLGERRLVALAIVLALATVGYGVYGMVDAQLGRRSFDACVADLRDERFGQATESCAEALEDNRDFAGAYNNLALAWLGEGRGETALEVCTEAAERFDRVLLVRDAPFCVELLGE